MTALIDKYDKEIEKINAILQKQQINQTAIQRRQNNIDELRKFIIYACKRIFYFPPYNLIFQTTNKKSIWIGNNWKNYREEQRPALKIIRFTK